MIHDKNEVLKFCKNITLWVGGSAVLIIVLLFSTPWIIYGYTINGQANTPSEKEFCSNILDSLGVIGIGVRMKLFGYDENNRLPWLDGDMDKAFADIEKSEFNRTLFFYLYKDMEIPENYFTSALHYISFVKCPKTLRMFIERGADINGKNKLGETPLHYASLSENIEAINMFLKEGADVNQKNNNGQTPLCWVSWRGDGSTAAEILINAGADVNAKDKNGLTPLHFCARFARYTETAKLLLEAGADINATRGDGTPLVWGVRNTTMVSYLIKMGADVNKVDSWGDTPLIQSIYDKNKSSFDELINAGANVKHRNKNGDTPLHHAGKRDDVYAASILLERGADINAKNNRGQTPIQESVSKGFMSFMISKGADVKDATESLHSACRYLFPEVVEVLLENGIDATAMQAGKTTLHVISSSATVDNKTKAIKIINLLLKADVNPHLLDKSGRKAIDLTSCEYVREILSSAMETFAEGEK